MGENYEDNYTPPTAEQRLMSESCRTCGEPMEHRGQCKPCYLEETESLVTVIERQIETLQIQREDIVREIAKNDARIEKFQEIVSSLEKSLKEIKNAE
jgi:predicted  nucleic acid-binding Zn-ribbon protein